MEAAYPVCLKLQDKKCLVIGGGEVAFRKTETLLEYGAKVDVITIEATEGVRRLADEGKIRLEIRPYAEGDEKGYFLVFAATGDAQVNRIIAGNCERESIWLNAVDDPPHCDFYVPAMLKRGDVTVAVSTSGNSPVLAAHIRDRIAPVVPEAYGTIAAMFGEVRTQVNASSLTMEEKKALYQEILSLDLLTMLEETPEAKVKEKIQSCISSRLA